MPIELRLLLGVTLAWGFVAMATPVAIRVAGRLDFYDRPVGYKGHARPTPYLGGAAVMAGFVVAIVIATGDWHRTLPLIIATAVLWAVGTLDDRRTVAPGLRVAVEAGLAAMLSLAGLGWHLGLGGAIELPLTVLWVVAVVNAFNLFDNMDGAASSMGFVVSTGVAVLGLAQGDPWVTATAAALAGACLGFLPHNLASPARIFLGDGGSMPLGFAVAALTMIGASQAVSAWPALIAGLLLVGVPLFDTFLVIVSRRRRGISVLTGGRDHLTHRARGRLRNARAVAVVLGGIQALFSALAVFASEDGSAVLMGGVLVYLAAAGVGLYLLERQHASRQPAADAAAALACTGAETGAPRTGWPALVLAITLGLGAGLSPFFGGYYDASVWVPIGIALLVVVTATALAASPRFGAPAILTLGGMVGLAVWSLVSTAWSDSVERALVEGNRTLVTGAILAVALMLVGVTRRPGWLVAATAVGIGAVALWVCAMLIGPHPDKLFLLGRLNEPLGYINAEGTVFAMGFWLCTGAAETRRPWLAGLAAGAAAVMGSLALLSQSRGVAVAILASGIVVLLMAPGRLRRSYFLLTVGTGILLAGGSLLHVYAAAHGAAVPVSAAHSAGWAMFASAVGVAIVWGLGVAATGGALSLGGPRAMVSLRSVGAAVLAFGALGAVVVTLASASAFDRALTVQWHAFVHLSEPTGSGASSGADQSRLVSGSGNRYDYWLIAWQAGRKHPFRGVGAGNYDIPYFSARHTTEDVRQPHSIELQSFSELGLVGVAFLAMFVVGLAVGAWRMRAPARDSHRQRTLMVAAVGGTSAWLAHTSVDWIHLLPGVTGIALVLASTFLMGTRPAPAPPAALPPWSLRPRSLLGGVGAATLLVLAGFSLSRQELAGVYATHAQAALATRPAQAIAEANRSLRLDAYKVDTYYTKAAGLARFNQGQAATATLLDAAQVEPSNFVTWALLGDLAVRRHEFNRAAVFYGRAHDLNPQDSGLATLAEDPHRALGIAPSSG